ncbi:MAG: hypothetical protein SFU86_11030 [Pirellulaceae bacterium]|nr:hypothetical protein [Pirellulaceae bacterium]
MSNKAHTATVRRLAARYGASIPLGGLPDLISGEMLIAVETSATLPAGVSRLATLSGRRYVAVTNRESLAEAFRLVEGTGIGVMNPQGDIVREAS